MFIKKVNDGNNGNDSSVFSVTQCALSTSNYPLDRGKQFVRMGGLADKLLCNVILFNLRMATNIIAAMNLVRRPPAIIIVIPKNILQSFLARLPNDHPDDQDENNQTILRWPRQLGR